MLLVNASHWPATLSKQSALYSINPNSPLDPHSCQRHYGAFAWVLAANEANEITAGRDHFGLEPFYYYYQPPYFIFGSSIPDILQHLEKTPELNERFAIECFSLNAYNIPPYSTKTFYEDIYRLTPGNLLHIRNGQLYEEPYWQLDPKFPILHYSNDDDYLEHFSYLLHEAVKHCANSSMHLSAEISGGLDSSAVLIACQQLQLDPLLFTHANETGIEETDEDRMRQQLIQQFNLGNKHQLVNAEHFDPMSAVQWCAQRFAGSSPYLFFMLAHHLHQTIAERGTKVLLSGYGGDECVSGQVPARAYLPECLKAKTYRKAWHELRCEYEMNERNTPSKLKRLAQLLEYSYPFLYQTMTKYREIKQIAAACFKSQREVSQTSLKRPFCRNIRQFEYNFLQGCYSHGLRMRIEYSAVAANALGFSYAYPLLYPPLVEFCFRLPLHQKRRDGIGRYLIRQYIARYANIQAPTKVKISGSIGGAALAKCREQWKQGKFGADIQTSRFQKYKTLNASEHTALMQDIYAYMMAYYLK